MQVILALATHLYFDHPYEPNPTERGYYWATRYTDTRKTFGFMPDNVYANADVKGSGEKLKQSDICGDEQCYQLTKPENIIGKILNQTHFLENIFHDNIILKKGLKL